MASCRRSEGCRRTAQRGQSEGGGSAVRTSWLRPRIRRESRCTGTEGKRWIKFAAKEPGGGIYPAAPLQMQFAIRRWDPRLEPTLPEIPQAEWGEGCFVLADGR